ncbi:DUF4123 domain-containing protein [Paraburkholderia sabiae]|uniref:DUF4123 domain-containing protein n=1 Tax=Paraburkholderia sabiae TaxID=273251 RepID=A0ABU9Q8P1_9BURK|nr:DUF4123 domain-containing protein [Paraburkholderia sabiae]WJZ77711.1 DUF4123 domain-containing protein [Paraburkholderia sabiae]CAD6532997.1 hypothetical protein LMG24235_02694 [Paraburkholderia sabiae]
MSINEFMKQVQGLPADPQLHFYLIVDAAQDPRLLAQLKQAIPGTRSQCLLTHVQGPDLDAAAPHLLTFPQFGADTQSWQWLADYGPALPAAVSIIATSLSFDALYAHLHSLIEVVLPDGDEMILAFWDPAILAMLVGQQDDTTLHVPGPALTIRQCEQLLAGVMAWWYWDRTGKLHQIRSNTNRDAAQKVMPPLRLTQTQVDMLVEASVPDHILGYILTNKPELLANIPKQERYPRVEKHLLEARKLHLLGMRDILDYVCAALIYGEKMHESSVIEVLLEKVRSRQISLTEALEQFP